MLQTDWLKVGTAGRTIDGREIKSDWLEKIAAAYTPSVYTASVNSEHFFYPGLGYVTALRAAKDEQGRTALYAKIAPTSELLARYQNKRQLFFSMEIRADFPAKGDVYLTGLAITDIPASQGLEPARFYAGTEGLERYFDTGRLEDEGQVQPVHTETMQTPTPTDHEAPPKWWSALWQALRPHAETAINQHNNEEHDAMTKQEAEAFEALEGEVTSLKTQVAELTEKFAAQAKAETEQEPEDTPDPVAEAMERFTADLEAKLAEAVAPLATRIEKLEAYLAEPMEGEQGEVTGPADAQGFVF